jgi:shikimate dehydrogenase
MSDIYAVAGNPVFHSRSPGIFNAAFKELSLDAVYVRLAASTAEEVLSTTREVGIKGLNITSPFKTDVIPFLDEVKADAQRVGSVNTVIERDGRLIGYNTDVAGVVGALKESEFEPKGKKAVVVGAGGAGRAAALALLSSGADVVLVNRTAAKADEAARILGCDALPLEHIGDALKGAHLLISSISSNGRVIEPSLLSKELTLFEANYGHPTALLRDATDAGCRLIDGRLWLLHQALPAFTLFTGKDAPAKHMRKALWKKRWAPHTNIALIGFMGTGKSSVAREIAGLSGLTFVDTDSAVEQRAGLPIAEIFDLKGEETFRMMEQAELQELWTLSHSAVSCGGGAVLSKRNRRVLRSTCVPVWLWADVKTVLARIGDSAVRPLLNGRNPEASTETLLKERLFHYASTSDFIINTAGKSPEEIAKRIWDEVGNTFNG